MLWQNFDGNPIGYKIYYTSYWDKDVEIERVNYTTNTTTLTNLRVYTEYAIAVAAVSSGGEGKGIPAFASTGEIRLLFLSCLVN